jgi:hypothetical protein
MDGIQMIPPKFVTQIMECAAGPVTFPNAFSTFSFYADAIFEKDALHPGPRMRPNPDVRLMGTNPGLIIFEGAEFQSQRQSEAAGFGVQGDFVNCRPMVHTPMALYHPVD